MELDTSTLMMIFFILALVVSIWKIYAFLPNKQLEDDDTTKESQEELENIVLKILNMHDKELSTHELFELVKNDVDFNKEHFWRFNLNRLNQILSTLKVKNLI